MSIKSPTPDPITAKRGSGKIVITNVTGTSTSSISVPEMTLSNVYSAANQIIANQASNFPAFLSINFQRVRTRDELQIALNASVDFLIVSAAASFNFNSTDTVARFLVTLNQSFYTLVYERPSNPSEFFHSSVTVDQLKSSVGNGNPPVYISQVNYGRVFHLLIEADASSSELSTSISTDFIFGGGSGSVKHLTDFNNLRVQAFAMGGDQSEAISAVLGGLNNLTTFLNSLKAGNQINSAVPLSYSVRAVSNDKLVKNAFITDYTFTECIPTGTGPCVPSPISPVADQQLPNGCEVTPHPFTWNFNWTDCAGATDYQIVIGHPNISTYRNETLSNTTTYSFNPPQPFSSSAYYSHWYWMVRAKTNGVWGEYSPVATFTVEPINSDCLTGIRLYEHPNYQGDSRWFSVDTPNLDDGNINFADVASSVRIYNLLKVRLYDFKNYGGPMIEITQDTPDLRTRNFNDLTGSIDFTPFR